MKLNIGCGVNHYAGFHNVDKFAACKPDEVVDAEVFPWPWATNSVTEVRFNHSLEHMGKDTNTFLQIMQELYRVCVPSAQVSITVPHPRHDAFLGDPTHVRAILPETLFAFDLAENQRLMSAGFSNTPLAMYTNTNFRCDSVDFTLDPRWQDRLAKGEITEVELADKVCDLNNVIQEFTITLTVIKPS